MLIELRILTYEKGNHSTTDYNVGSEHSSASFLSLPSPPVMGGANSFALFVLQVAAELGGCMQAGTRRIPGVAIRS